MAVFFMFQRSLEFRNCITLFDILSSCNNVADVSMMFKTALNTRRGGFTMKTGMNILKLVGKAAAGVIIWVVGKLGGNNMSANVETMFSARVKPWHGIGTVVEECPNSKEALWLAGLD